MQKPSQLPGLLRATQALQTDLGSLESPKRGELDDEPESSSQPSAHPVFALSYPGSSLGGSVRGSPDTAEMIKPIKLQQTERRGNQCCPPEKGRLGRQDTEPELDWSWVEKALHSAPLAERAP